MVRDVVLLCLNPRRHKHTRDYDYGDERGGEHADVLDLLRLIDDELGEGIATPDHVLTAAQTIASLLRHGAGAGLSDGGTLSAGLPGRRRPGADLPGRHRAGGGCGANLPVARRRPGRHRPAGVERHDLALRGTRDVRRGRPAVHGPGSASPRREHLRHRGQRAGIGRRDEAQGGVRLRLRDPPHNGLVPTPGRTSRRGPWKPSWSCFGRTRVSSASQRRATTTPGGRPGRAHSLMCSPSGRSRPTGATVRTSAITGLGRRIRTRREAHQRHRQRYVHLPDPAQ